MFPRTANRVSLDEAMTVNWSRHMMLTICAALLVIAAVAAAWAVESGFGTRADAGRRAPPPSCRHLLPVRRPRRRPTPLSARALVDESHARGDIGRDEPLQRRGDLG